MNWIRITVDMPDDPRIGRIAAAAQISPDEAAGKVLRVLCKLPAHARDGDVSTVPDEVLETWANWRGKASRFASAFRAELCDDTGKVRSWEKHNGAAIRESDRTKERVKEWRDGKKRTGDVTGNVRGNERRTLPVDGTGREITTAPSSDAAVVRGGAADWVPLHFPDPAHQQAVSGYIRAHQFPDALRATLTAIASGQGAPNGQPVPWATIGQAVVEMQSAGARFSASALRGFIGRLCQASADVTWDDIFRSASAPEASHVA